MIRLKKRNKRGWIKIVEAFIAILMIVSVLTVIVMKDLVTRDDGSDNIYEEEFYILQKIQINSSLRADILELSTLPLESTDPSFPFEEDSVLNSTALGTFNCTFKICVPNQGCVLNNFPEEQEVFGKSVIINSDLNTYNPRELGLFCWRN